MEREDVIRLMKTYDFKENSAASFSKTYGITPKTIKKLLLQHSIPHNTHRINIKQPRDVHGRFQIATKSTKPKMTVVSKPITKIVSEPVTKNVSKQMNVDDSTKKLSGKPAEKQFRELRKFYK
jgi:hypothetical protein